MILTLMMMLLPLWMHKALVVPVLPVGFCLVMCALGMVLRKRRYCAAGIVALGILSTQAAGDWLLTPLERAYAKVDATQSVEADAAVVLSGMLEENLEWGEAVDRFEGGLALLREGRVKRVVFTAGQMPWKDGPVEGEVLRREALRRGIAEEHIVLAAGQAGNTADEAAAVKRLMGERGWRRVILVTSAFHMKRAMRLMRKAGVDAEAFPVDYRARQRPGSVWTDWLPGARGLQHSETALREYWGLLFYMVAGGM